MEQATEADAQKIAPEAVKTSPEDAEARYKKLEEEKENYRKAYLKASSKTKTQESDDSEEDEDKISLAVKKALAESHLADIAREQQALIESTMKENKELKLAHLNKTGTPPAGMGSHSESAPVRDTAVTPDQMAYFKNVLKWDDKTIERYKKNQGKRV